VSYLQFNNPEEIEQHMRQNGMESAFVTEDNRLYSSVELWDKFCAYRLPVETVMQLHQLQSDVENMGDGSYEVSFLDIAEAAQSLQKSFEKLMDQLKIQRIEKISPHPVLSG
jgi:hypothetical protein